jgi:hypothetical protein
VTGSSALSAQRAAWQALDHLAARHPDLPGGYIVQSDITPGRIDVQLDGFTDLEAWRAALGVDPAAVGFGPCGENRKLELTAEVAGTTVCVYAIESLAVAVADGGAA